MTAAAEKECFKCHRTLPLSEFYRLARMADGHLNKCRTCTRNDVRTNRDAKREKYLEYDRQRSKDPERQAAITASTNRDPLKVWARKASHNALYAGILERQPCEVCGEEKTDMHHEDYAQPLKVRWFCRKHHMGTHYPLETIQPF